MRSVQLGLYVGLLAALVGCDGSFEVGDCDRDDAGRCIPLFPERDAGGPVGMDSGFDGGLGHDGATLPTDATTADATTVHDSAAPFDSGIDASTSDAAAPVTLTPGQFCEAQFATARAWQARFDDLNCECLSTMDRARAQEFMVDVLLLRENSISGCTTFVENLRTAGVTFDGTKAPACASSFASQFKGPDQFMAPVASCPGGFDVARLEAEIGHGVQVLTQLPACRETLAGTKAANAVCTSDFECSGGLRCRSVPGGGESRCQNALAAGDPCTGSDDCRDGLVCALNVPASGGTAAQSTCIPRESLKLQTGNCARSSECIAGLICDGAKCVAPAAERICD